MSDLLDPSRYPRVKFTTAGRQERLLATTTAPANYDGFGTLTLAPNPLMGPQGRLVLIHPEHLEWQIRRYASGNYFGGPVPFPSEPEDT